MIIIIIIIIANNVLLSNRILESDELESGHAMGKPAYSDPPDQQQLSSSVSASSSSSSSSSSSAAAVVHDFFSMDECFSDKRRSSGKYVMKGEQTNASRAALKTQLMRLKQSTDQQQLQPNAVVAGATVISTSMHTSSKAVLQTPAVKAAAGGAADIKPILSNLQTPANPLLRSKKQHKGVRSTDKTALEGVSTAVDELPPGWTERVDKRSSRAFYVNT